MKRYRDIVGDGGSNIAGQVEAQQARLRERLSRVRAIVAVVSGSSARDEQPGARGEPMNQAKKVAADDEMLPEYDL